MSKYPYDKSCLHCNNIFVINCPQSNKQKYCTQMCANESKRKHHKEIQCVQCQKPLRRHQRRFCSRSCSAIFNNALSPKRAKKVKIDRLKIPRKSNIILRSKPANGYNCQCKHCGYRFVSMKAQKYCNDHATLYSHAGRARYWFSINVFKYPELFDLDDLMKIGFRSKENPNGYTRDHKVSVNEAIRNGYDPYYITHVMNCELMLWPENNQKKTKSSINYEELVRRVNEYDSKNSKG